MSSTDVSSANQNEPHEGSETETETMQRDFYFLPIPKYLRYNPDAPHQFNLLTNILFGIASTCIVANLYYCQPLLIQLSISFDVTYDEVSRIPTLVQAGYATGLLFVTPLGDLVRRRPLILLLFTICTFLTLGLPLTSNILIFELLSFFIGTTSNVPQILMALAADLAPPSQRASALSVVLSGLLLGVLVARVVAGVVANFVQWRIVYWLAMGMQGSMLLLLWARLPDYPAKNRGMSYFGVLGSMARFAVTEPVLVQAVLVNLASMSCFTNFWVTLTFLLGGPIYNYSTLIIGLFGLIGMGGVLTAPLIGRIIDRIVPWYGGLTAILASLLFYTIQLGAGGVSVGAVIVVTFGIDVFRQTQQVSLATQVLGLDARARSRMNAVLIISIFVGQIVGTSVGTHVFNAHGWRAAAALSVGWSCFSLLVTLARGPHCERYTWLGYQGGFAVWKKSGGGPADLEKQESTGDAVETGGGNEAVKSEKPEEGRDEGRESCEKTPKVEP
ncbi:MFS general substrate transporter [Trametopsis cervina]|nr:MFS general substrate transporter [Trametopsis cervina]